MPYYRWRNYGYGRRYYGRYYGGTYRRRATSTTRRRANGETRAAKGQRDNATVTISRIATVAVTIAQNTSSGATAINHWNQLRLSEFYSNYMPMYDQVKLDKIKVRVTGNQSGTAVTANLSPAVVLAFDRNGLNSDQTINTAVISTYSSAQLKQWSTGNSFVMNQVIYPSTIMEKGQYIPTGSLVASQDDNNVPSNPCNNISDPTLPFKPITLIGVDMGSSMSAEQNFAFTVEYEYTVTFRGMRKPSLGSSSSVLVPFTGNFTSNGAYQVLPSSYNADGFNQLSLTVDVPQEGDVPNLVDLQYDVFRNGVDVIDAGSYNADGFSRVTLTVSVETGVPEIVAIGVASSATDFDTTQFALGTGTSVEIPEGCTLCVLTTKDDFRAIINYGGAVSSTVVQVNQYYHLFEVVGTIYFVFNSEYNGNTYYSVASTQLSSGVDTITMLNFPFYFALPS